LVIIAIILGGSLYYTWVKHIETQNAAPAKGPYERVPMEDIEGGKKSPDRVD